VIANSDKNQQHFYAKRNVDVIVWGFRSKKKASGYEIHCDANRGASDDQPGKSGQRKRVAAELKPEQPEIKSSNDTDQEDHAVNVNALQGGKNRERFPNRHTDPLIIEPLQQIHEHVLSEPDPSPGDDHPGPQDHRKCSDNFCPDRRAGFVVPLSNLAIYREMECRHIQSRHDDE
jgi:hypothetical protein